MDNVVRIETASKPGLVDYEGHESTGEPYGQQVFGGGSGGGSKVDTETKNYVDANMRAVKAENSSSFARLEAKIDSIQPGATWQQNAGVSITAIVVGLGIVFAVLVYASDRFDSGVGAMGAVEEEDNEDV